MGGRMMEHPQALRSLEALVQALWPTHHFLVDGESVSERSEVIQALREDRIVSFYPRDTLK